MLDLYPKVRSLLCELHILKNADDGRVRTLEDKKLMNTIPMNPSADIPKETI